LPNFDPFRELRGRLAQFGPPVVVFNKSHSGSRVLARVLEEAGVFLGAHTNPSMDSLDLLRLVEHLVTTRYPDYGPAFRAPDRILNELIADVFSSHMQGFEGGRWGWKLCETTFILPLIHELFPDALYLHLLRDGRDVAFCDHVAPRDPFWKKIYFNTDKIRYWRGLPLSRSTYRVLSPLYNARHWANSVTVGRAYGMMLGDRYMEVRYEDLIQNFPDTTRALLGFLGLEATPDALADVERSLVKSKVGNHRQRSRFLRWLAFRELEPTLAAFGYGPNS
jgi:hypothetical protein